jgi:hypothetical protein
LQDVASRRVRERVEDVVDFIEVAKPLRSASRQLALIAGEFG